MKTLALLLLLIAASLAGAQPDTSNMVLSEDKAYMLMPPVPFSGAQSHKLSWSSDGKYVMVQRENVFPLPDQPWAAREESNEEIVVYNAAKHQTRTVFSTKSAKTAITKIAWIYNSSTILAEVDESIRSTNLDEPPSTAGHIYAIDAASGSYTEIASSTGENESVDFETAPKFSGALLTLKKFPAQVSPGTPIEVDMTYVVLGANGKPTNTPVGMKASYFNYWAEDGATAVFQRYEKSGPKAYLLNLTSSTFQPTEGIPDNGGITASMPGTPVSKAPQHIIARYKDSEVNAEVHLEIGSGEAISSPATKSLMPTFLCASTANPSKALIVSDTEDIALSPTSDAVAYITQGVAMVRPISSVPKAVYEQAQKAAEKVRLISIAKQIGLAVLMNASDNDDILVSSNADLNEQLGPYMKNPKLLEGLVYTFKGGNAADVESPAETELGYIPGSGGRAVIYVDGHVIWRDDK